LSGRGRRRREAADGLQRALEPGELTVVVNTGDDFERHSLLVCPDQDTVLYTLAGIVEPAQGWGIAGETWQVMSQLARLGQETWFRLGDKDVATHLFRTERLRRGERLTEVALKLGAALGVPSRILPMTDEPVRTRVRTDDGWIDFQDYFVRLGQAPEVREVRFEGAGNSSVTPEVKEALAAAEAIVVAPSNPIVSIGPIVAVPGIGEAIAAARRVASERRRLRHRRREALRAGRPNDGQPWRRADGAWGRPPIRIAGAAGRLRP